MTPLHVGGVYLHVKTGHTYRLLAVAKDSENLNDLVVYEALYPNSVSKVWVRALEHFIGEAKTPEGTMHPRFQYLAGEK
jgi:hypothetical protein